MPTTHRTWPAHLLKDVERCLKPQTQQHLDGTPRRKLVRKCKKMCKGSGDSPAVERWFESRHKRRENFLLQGQLSVLTFISVSILPPCYRSTCKIFQSFCQKCRWQVTAKHTSTLRIWLHFFLLSLSVFTGIL